MGNVDTLVMPRHHYLLICCDAAQRGSYSFRWHYFSTDVLSCQQDKLVAATNAHRKDLMSKIERLKPQGTSELE